MSAMHRRRALRIFAAGAGLLAGGATLRALAPSPKLHRWRGEAMGAPAEIALAHRSDARARTVLRKVESELARYHRILDLGDANSEISRLNRDGALADAAPELRALIETGQRLGELSDGAFDITVQPLWRTYESHFWSRTDIAPDIAARAGDTAGRLVDYRGVDVGSRRVSLAREGMGVTLNSMAQGFVTDRIVDLLRNEGFESAFVDLGEMRALGAHPEGRPWRVALRNPSSAATAPRELDLADMAVAVSGGYGTTFEPTGRFHHLFDPRSGASAAALRDVAVIGPDATTADALSTAICVAGEETGARLIAAHPGFRAFATRNDGERVALAPRHA